MPRKHNYRKIWGRNKIRDGRIIMDFKKNDLPIQAIAIKYKLTDVRIWQILNINHILIPINRELERKRQLWRVQNQLNLLKNNPTRKDKQDWEELYRKLLEEKTALIDQSQHTNIYQKVEVLIDKNDTISSAPKSRFGIQQ